MRLVRNLAAAVLFCATVQVTYAAPTIDVLKLTPSNDGVQITYGPVGQKIGAIAPKGSKSMAVVDGVEGPKVDQFVSPGGSSPFIFSDDGQHIAYMARQGQELLIVSDSQEVFRTKMAGGINPVVYPPTYSPKGTHFFFGTKEGQAESVFLFDGKPAPLANGPVYFSADESTYAYPSIAVADGKQKQILIVNGQSSDAPTLEKLAVTRDGKVLIGSHDPERGEIEVTYDGKPVGKLSMVGEFILPAAGTGWACFGQDLRNSGKWIALVNGQRIDVDGRVEGIHFNADGTKAAIHCVSAQYDHTVLVDGKSAGEYAGVDKIAWTGDGSKVVYVASSRNGKQFVIIGDEESDPLPMLPAHLAVAPAGDAVVYAVANPQDQRQQTIYANHKPAGTVAALMSVTFAANGKNWFGITGRNEPVLNGKTLPGVRAEKMAISPDSKHIAVVGTDLKTNKPIVVVDGKVVPITNTRIDVIFSTDGKHAFWMQPKYGQGGRWEAESLMLDGVEIKTVQRGGREQMGSDFPSEAANADGTFSVLVNDENTLQRLTIKPDESTSVDTIGK
ncbi:MAG: hypothetical protein QM770_19285 [Tepidisphaeraceae bacterium]